jgi:probable blue pigment (indigoidine) exporter
LKNILIGLTFAALWASASAATKFGLMSAQPLIIADFRFFIAGVLMLVYTHLLSRNRLPLRHEWRPLAIYGFLNITLYLGCFVFAMREISAGIGSLSVALSPLIISVVSAVWLKRAIRRQEVWGLCFGIAGVAVATYPLLQHSYVTIRGLVLISTSMVAYSFATVYYARIQWQMPRITINAWQIILGGVFMLPLTLFFYHKDQNNFDLRFCLSVAWLVLPVSILAIQLWLYMVKQDSVKAASWLFLCPIVGFVIAYFLLKEPVTLYTCVGTGLVIAGLVLAQQAKQEQLTE